MARTLSVMAYAQALVPVIALLFLKIAPISGPAGLIILVLNIGFIILFVGSALLFRRASGPRRPAEPTPEKS